MADTRQGGESGKGGTTERDHGGKGSHMPERAEGEDRHTDGRTTSMEDGPTSTDGSGPGDERSGPTGRERKDGDGTLPDSGPTTRITR